MIKALHGIGGAGLPILALVLAASGATAATKPATKPPTDSPIQILPGTSSKEPISIDADKLVYFDKEQKAVYSGNVVVIQGDTKMTCSVMTVFLDHQPTPAATTAAAKKPPDPQAVLRRAQASSGSKRPGRSPSSPRRRWRPATSPSTTRAKTR